MNKLIVIVLIVVLVGIGCLSQLHPSQLQSVQKISFLPEVKGCAANGSTKATKSFGKEKEAEIKVENNEIIYSRAISHLCCRKVRLDYKIEDSTVNIYEVWSGIGCKCICFSEISAKLENLSAGKYTVRVYETGVKPDGKPMEDELIISKEVTVG